MSLLPKAVQGHAIPPPGKLKPAWEPRLIMRGVRYGDFAFPALKPIKDVKIFMKQDVLKRHVAAVQVSLGCHVQGHSRPHVDFNDSDTVLAGACKRVFVSTPVPQPGKLEEIRVFARKFFRDQFSKIDAHCDLSVESWLQRTGYPGWRCDELRAAWDSRGPKFTPKDRAVKYFVKDECYDEIDKFARLINARSDRMKCYFGPFFKAMEDRVYHHPAFIKHVPVNERPQYILDHVMDVGCQYASGDFTAFESHFTRDVMEAIEWELYDYMTSDLTRHKEFMTMLRSVIGGRNRCVGRFFDYEIEATRMSGEMNTSLGNAIANLVLIKFVYGLDARCVVEGDDSLVAFRGEPVSPSVFRDLGWTVKIEVSNEVSKAGFCKMYFDPVEKINLTDPRRVLAGFGYANSGYVRYGRKKLKALLKCKAMSYLSQYPGCPIIQGLAVHVLKKTKSCDVRSFVRNDRHLDSWERSKLLSILDKNLTPRPVSMSSRLLMEELFDVPVELQLAIEQHFEKLDRIGELSGPVLELFPGSNVYATYYREYHQVVTDPIQLSDGSFVKHQLFRPPVVVPNNRPR